MRLHRLVQLEHRRAAVPQHPPHDYREARDPREVRVAGPAHGAAIAAGQGGREQLRAHPRRVVDRRRLIPIKPRPRRRRQPRRPRPLRETASTPQPYRRRRSTRPPPTAATASGLATTGRRSRLLAGGPGTAALAAPRGRHPAQPVSCSLRIRAIIAGGASGDRGGGNGRACVDDPAGQLPASAGRSARVRRRSRSTSWNAPARTENPPRAG